jgi:serine/threonine protein kinase
LTSEKKPEFYVDQKSTQIYGHYHILEELAQGGMGIVYKAYHPGLNQMYALKVLLAKEDVSEHSLKRFHREIKTTAKLKHPGIVKIVDSGERGEEHYFVMELVEGKTLEDWMKNKPSIREGVLVIQKCLEALEYAHSQGVIHRDLKPQNILVTLEGEPKITDFGLAKDFELNSQSQQITHTGAILGTPSYMSPEQASGENRLIGPCSDVYSLGVCLYELLASRCPFKSSDFIILLEKILKEEPVPPSAYNDKIHPDLEWIVLKSLKKNPEERYASAKAFQEDLERFLEGYPISGKASYQKEVIVKWSKRNSSQIVLGVLSFLCGFLISFLLFYGLR